MFIGLLAAPACWRGIIALSWFWRPAGLTQTLSACWRGAVTSQDLQACWPAESSPMMRYILATCWPDPKTSFSAGEWN